MSILDLTTATRLFWGSTEARQLWLNGDMLWERPGSVPPSDIFDDAVSPYHIKQNLGASSGCTATGSAHWGDKEGIGGVGTTTGTEWRVTTNTSRGSMKIAFNSLTMTNGKSRVRWRCKPVDWPSGKLYVQFAPASMTTSPSVVFDITPDGTPDNARVFSTSGAASNAAIAKHPTNGWWYFRFDLDMTGVSDRIGTLEATLLDQPGVDLLVLKTPFYLIRCQDLTIQSV